ncbi:hypothetical protein EDC01DRAFT_610201 [Geopyxis carbonaria]|nr:hypothetical protein EDC01DRAFT_610201 [Geopyxis carbonaria]
MDPVAIHRFLESVMEAPAVTGAILIDSASGLCLGAAGKAKEDDAPHLSIAAKTACDAQGVGIVKLRECKIVMRRGEGVLVGVFRDA